MTYRGTRFQVIGVAEDHHWKDVTEKVAPLMYLPLGHGQLRSATVLVRSTRPEAEASRAAQRLALAIDPTLPIVEGLPPRMTVARQLAPRLLFARLLGFLSVIAMALAALGLYGAISHTVTQRRRELGLRLALGAAPRIILRSVLARAAGFLAGGLTLGLAGAAGLMALMRSRLFGIAPTDVATYAFAAGILVVTTIAAAAIPARAAARIDPARTLRNE